jgi:hypothetical protein
MGGFDKVISTTQSRKFAHVTILTYFFAVRDCFERVWFVMLGRGIARKVSRLRWRRYNYSYVCQEMAE